MATEQIYQQRLDRILKAVALERSDRTPVVLEYAGFAAHVTETPIAEYLRDPARNLELMIKAWDLVGDGDAINYGSFWPYALCNDFMAKVRIPGVDLPDNDMWQIDEKELMKPADYDVILEADWPQYFQTFLNERILDDVPAEYLPPIRKSPDTLGAWKSHGVPVLSGGDVTTPFELLCGSRSLMEFCVDLMKIPDKVEAVMDVIAPHLTANTIKQAKQQGYPGVWVGGWRTAPAMLSPEMWDRFVWPYFKQVVTEITDAGLIAFLHLDSDWTREFARFKELPRAKCVMALDGESDIRKARKVLDEHMCIMGDVPASLLFSGSAEEVSDYCTSLIRDMGSSGFILQSGCDIPTNARLENVQAMVRAATG